MWPGLQINEGDQFSVVFQLNNVPMGTSGLVNVNVTWSGTAYNVADLRTTAGTTLSPSNLPTSNIRSIAITGNNRSAVTFLAAADGTAEGDETIAVTLDSLHATSVAGFTIGTPWPSASPPAPGEAFTYAAQSSDPSVASARVEAGVLVVEAEGDGMATVTVTATDAHGQTGTLTFTVRATLPMRGGLRGWRLILIEPSAAGDAP